MVCVRMVVIHVTAAINVGLGIMEIIKRIGRANADRRLQTRDKGKDVGSVGRGDQLTCNLADRCIVHSLISQHTTLESVLQHVALADGT